MPKRTTLLGFAAVAALLALLGWAFAPRPVAVETAVVAQARFEDAIEEDGRTRVRERYAVSAPVTARLARIALREGDRIAAGDAVAVLTPVMPSMVDERSLREAGARVRAAQSAVSAATARLERIRVDEEEARLDLQRTERLAREGYVAGARLDQARLALEAARRERESADAARSIAVHERAQAAAMLQSPGTAAGQPLTVSAPVGGVVLRVAQTSESTVAAGTVLLEIGEPARMEIVADLLTTDAVRARPGTRAVVERWGGPAIAARVRRVEPAAFTKVSALGVEEQRVRVLLDLVDPPAEWRGMGDGYRVTVRIITTEVPDALVVPVGALFPHADGGLAVYRLDGSRARLVAVDAAGRNASVGWIRSGLAAGDRVVVYPPPGVRDGARVAAR